MQPGYLALLDPYSLSLISDCTGTSTCTFNPGVTPPSLALNTDNPAIGVFTPPSTYDASGFYRLPYTPLTKGITNYSLGTPSTGFYNTSTAQRRSGIASNTVSGSSDVTNALFIAAHDIDAGVGVEVVSNFALSGTIFGYDSTPFTFTIADPTMLCSRPRPPPPEVPAFPSPASTT